jgi:uncharacterized protein (TIGR02598 family)
MNKNRLLNAGLKAFTLVEVSLACGLISFALVSILGLMSVGLNTLRETMGRTVEGQIVQKLSAQILLVPFSQLQMNYATPQNLFYDQEGEEVSGSTSAAYTVSIQPPATAVYPGYTNAPTPTSSSLCLMQISVKRDQGSRAPNRYNLYVANSGN